MGQLAPFACRYVCPLPNVRPPRAPAHGHGREAWDTESTLTQTALTFVLAPVPNSICSRCARADDISPEYNSAYVDFGRFLTGMLVVSHVAISSGQTYGGRQGEAFSEFAQEATKQ